MEMGSAADGRRHAQNREIIAADQFHGNLAGPRQHQITDAEYQTQDFPHAEKAKDQDCRAEAS